MKKDVKTVEKMEIVPNLEDHGEVDFLSYKPSDVMKQWKSQFWMSVKDSPVLDPTTLSLAAISSLARSGGNRLRNELSNPAARAWFFNQNVAQVMIQASAELAVETLIKIMLSDDPKMAASRVKSAELILKYSGLEPVKRIDINNKQENMSGEELDNFLREGLKKLNYVKLDDPIDVK